MYLHTLVNYICISKPGCDDDGDEGDILLKAKSQTLSSSHSLSYYRNFAVAYLDIQILH